MFRGKHVVVRAESYLVWSEHDFEEKHDVRWIVISGNICLEFFGRKICFGRK